MSDSNRVELWIRSEKVARALAIALEQTYPVLNQLMVEESNRRNFTSAIDFSETMNDIKNLIEELEEWEG